MRDETQNHEALANNDAHNIDDPAGQSTPRAPDTRIRFTVFQRADKKPLSKTLKLVKGKLTKELCATLTLGSYATYDADDIDAVVRALRDRTVFGPHCACAYGARPQDEGLIDTKDRIDKKKAKPKAIARTEENFPWRAGPSVMLVDIDAVEGVDLTPHVIDDVFRTVVPWWGGVRRAYIPSASSNIYRKSDGASVSRKNGYHIYIAVDDGTKIRALGDEIFIRLVDAGYGFHWVAKNGNLQVRTWLDRAVYTSCHLDFAFGPHIPADQDLGQRCEPVWFDGAPMLETEGKGRNDFNEWLRTSEAAQKILNSLKALTESDAARQAWIEEQVPRAKEHAAKAGGTVRCRRERMASSLCTMTSSCTVRKEHSLSVMCSTTLRSTMRAQLTTRWSRGPAGPKPLQPEATGAVIEVTR
jgi:hypothetical protein